MLRQFEQSSRVKNRCSSIVNYSNCNLNYYSSFNNKPGSITYLYSAFLYLHVGIVINTMSSPTYKMGIVINTVHLVIDKALFKKNRVQRHISESISKKTASISSLTRSISKKSTSVCIFQSLFAYFMVQATSIKGS